MFTHRDKAYISSDPSSFTVRYVGEVCTWETGGLGCTVEAVQKIWDSAAPERELQTVTLTISTSGLCLQYDSNKKKQFHIQYICYCCGESVNHTRVFAWIYRNPKIRHGTCHAVVCSYKEKAQTIAATMSKAFYIAYHGWKHNQIPLTKNNRKESSASDIVHSSVEKGLCCMKANADDQNEDEAEAESDIIEVSRL